MTMVFNYTKSPCAPDRLDAEIRANANITIALANGSTLLGNALTITFRTDLPDDGTNVASVTCQPAVLQAIVTAHGGVPLTPPPQTVTSSDPKDSDGASLGRIKQTTIGWTFQELNTGFNLSTLGSVQSNDISNAAHNYATLKFYETVAGAESAIAVGNLNQTYLTANNVKTVVDIEPTFDFDVISGEFRYDGSQIGTDIFLWVIAVPDVPYNLGGSRVLIDARNLRFTKPQEPVVVDGRVTKHLAYSNVYHSNKIRFIFRHGVGVSLISQASLQFYKA